MRWMMLSSLLLASCGTPAATQDAGGCPAGCAGGQTCCGSVFYIRDRRYAPIDATTRSVWT